jgi:hypothetical protein
MGIRERESPCNDPSDLRAHADLIADDVGSRHAPEITRIRNNRVGRNIRRLVAAPRPSNRHMPLIHPVA